MTQSITQAELESYLWGAAVLLRGFIDTDDYKQFIFPLMFFKQLCDVYDEEREWAVKVALRQTLAKYQLHTDNDLFDRAYGYIAAYY